MKGFKVAITNRNCLKTQRNHPIGGPLNEVKTFIHHGNHLLEMVIIIKTQKHYKTKCHSISVRNKWPLIFYCNYECLWSSFAERTRCGAPVEYWDILLFFWVMIIQAEKNEWLAAHLLVFSVCRNPVADVNKLYHLHIFYMFHLPHNISFNTDLAGGERRATKGSLIMQTFALDGTVSGSRILSVVGPSEFSLPLFLYLLCMSWFHWRRMNDFPG